MAVKKNTYIDMELSWAESQLASWKAFIDANPIETLKHDIEWKPTSKGGAIPMVIASIQQQGKFIQETLKNYLALLAEVDRLREKEEAKQINVRGDQSLNPFESGEI